MIRASFCIAIIIFFLAFSVYGAPPNPKRFFDQTEDGKLVPKMSIAEINELMMFDPDIVRTNYIQQPDGIEYILALRIDFSDQPGQKPASVFDQAIFGKEGTSMYLYFDEVSYGQMQIQPGYLGGVMPRGNRWYRAKNKMTYYGAGSVMADRYRELVEEACIAADAEVDFSRYDRDGDGFVDHLMIIHSGNDEASTGVPGDIWSAAIDGIPGVYDGTRIMSAIIVAEDPSEDYLNIGIFCHEFFHEFGAPDLYAWTYPAGYWCLMGMFGPYLNNGQNPSHISSYLKWDFDADRSNGINGWLNPIELTEHGTYFVDSLSLPTGNRSYKIDIPGKYGREYFMIENRNNKAGTRYDTFLPESGIIIWHIDENQPKSFANPSRAWVEDPSDPDRESKRKATSGAAFSLEDKETAFTPSTYPNSNANSGMSSGIIIIDIGPRGNSMPFTLFFDDTYEPNGSISEAFGPLLFGKEYISFIKDQTDIDYYMMNIKENSLINVHLKSSSGAKKFDFVIYDAQKNLVSVSEEIFGISKTLSFTSKKGGIYYISISSDNAYGFNQAYTLMVDSISPDLAPEMIRINRIYPNPGPDKNGYINIEYKLLAPIDSITIDIYTINGQLLYTQEKDIPLPSGKISIDISRLGFASGVYVYSIKAKLADEIKQKTGKFAIIR